MTIEEYDRASKIIIELNSLNDNIRELRSILDNDTTSWRMEVRASASHSHRVIQHYGMLPRFLEEVLSKQIAEYNALKLELEEL